MEFTFKEYFWQADAPLPAWSDFTQSDTTPVTFAPEGRDETPPLSDEEIALAQWLYDHHAQQKTALLNAVLLAYPEARRQFFDDYDIDENEDDLPTIRSVDGLPLVITLQDINVHQIEKAGMPYVGYQFACKWEEEHGLGVLMHGARVVEIGGAETAFTLWIAERDLKR